MNKAQRSLAFLACLLAAAAGLSAMGTKESDFKSADGTENWQRDIDISSYPPGTYNIYVEAKDGAGNVGIGGPFNVKIDPKSALPVVRVLNPLPGQRVGGDLTIVGTCSAKRGVGRVELSIDGGPFLAAEGTDLWTMVVKTADIPDGRRTLVVRGVDAKDLVGPETKIVFDLDHHKPAVAVASPGQGALVAGSVKLSGKVSDANGVRSLELSLDNQKSWKPVGLSKGKTKESANFALSVDSKKLGDGPRVLWFRAADGVGSTSVSAHLLVVDNTAPTISLVRPVPKTAVHGRFLVAGTVRDLVGVRRLSYVFGGTQKGEIELSPGDPYFAKELDCASIKGDRADLVLTVEDRVGNVTKLLVSSPIDRQAEKPRVALSFPQPGGRVAAGQSLWGSVAADEGAAGVRWSIDGGKSTDTPASDIFVFSLPDMASGKHILTIAGLDAAGRVGDPKSLPFMYDRGAGRVGFDKIGLASTSAARPASGKAAPATAQGYSPGIEVRVDGGQDLEGSVTSPNPPVKAEWRIEPSGAPHALALTKAGGDEYGFRIPIDRALPFGFAPIELDVTDTFGSVLRGQALLYVTDYAQSREDTGFVFEDGRADSNGSVGIGPDDPFRGVFFRERLVSVRLDPPTDLVKAVVSGQDVELQYSKEGVSGPTKVVGTTAAGRSFSAGPFTFVTDHTAPIVDIDSPGQGLWVRDRLELRGHVKDEGALATLRWRVLPDGPERDLKPGVGGAFSLSLSGADLPSGPAALEVEAVDAAGNASRAALAFAVSNEPPNVRFVCPEPGSTVWGPEDIAATIDDASGIASVEYAEDGKTFAPIDFRDGSFVHRADLSAHPGASYRVTDLAGNVSVVAPQVTVGPAPGAEPAPPPTSGAKTSAPGSASGSAPGSAEGPSIALVYPEPGAQLNAGSVPLVFRIADPRGLSSARLQLGDKKTELPVAEGGRYFAILVDPRSAGKAGSLAGSLVATNAAGKSATLAVSFQAPPAWGRPRIAPVLPADGVLDPGAALVATADAGAGAASLSLALDGSEIARSDCGSVAALLPVIPAGRHKLLVTATALGDRRASVERDILVRGSAPSFGDISIGDAKARTPWSPGIAVPSETPPTVFGTLSAPNGRSSLTCTVNGTNVPVVLAKPSSPSPKNVAAGAPVAFSVALPSLPFGRVAVRLEAKDAAGLTTARSYFFIATLPARSGEDNEDGIRFFDAAVKGEGADREVLLQPSRELTGRFQGRAIKSVATEPPVDFIRLSFDGPIIHVEATAAGRSPSASIVVETVDGDRFSWGPAMFVSDGSPPSVDLASPADSAWVRDSLDLAGVARDDLGVATVEYAIDGSDFRTLPRVVAAPAPAPQPASRPASPARGGPPPSVRAGAGQAASAPPPSPGGSPGVAATAPPAATEYRFEQRIALDQGDGPFVLVVRVRDVSGKETSVQRLLRKDTEQPHMTQILPPPGERVTDPVTFVGEASDSGALDSIQFLPAPDAQSQPVTGLANFSAGLDAIKLDFPLPEGGGFVAVDKAGNKALLAPAFSVDKKAMLPVVEIHTPPEGEVLRQDFAVTGVAYDAAGVAAVDYRLDGGEWKRLAMDGLSFTVPLALASLADNEHKIEFRAENIYGLQGEIASRGFRISLAEPAASLASPAASEVVAGTVELSGSASDGNGVKSMALSVDNGASFLEPEGAESWHYSLDTRLLRDGPHAVELRPVDGYDTVGFAAGAITVDNTPPDVALDLPPDGSSQAQSLLVSGRASDNLGLAASWVEILPAGKALPPLLKVSLGTNRIVRQKIDITSLDAGTYTVRLVARDRAGNQSLASRDIVVLGKTPGDTVSLLYPQPGAVVTEELRVSARAQVAGGASQAELLLDGTSAGSAVPDERGYFSLVLSASSLAEGSHRISARALAPDGRTVVSPEVLFEFHALGPWIAIDNFKTGAFLPYRPFIKGHAGWSAAKPDSGDRAALAAFAKAQAAHAVAAVEYSLDGGTTYKEASGGSSWSLRLETEEYAEGPLFLLLRARFKDGSTATTATLLDLDKTAPSVDVLSPREGDRQFESMRVIGTASDSDGVDQVRVALRKGDKAAYQVPSFIQGLYVDGHFFGATTWETGLGLTFFDDNVKLQALYGSAPATDASGQAQSFYGSVFGAKLIANIAYLPMNYLFGPDWSFLSMSLGLGANFTYFTETQSGGGLLVGAVFAQLEFPKFTLKDWTAFKKYSFYTEYQLWVLSSVVSGGFVQRLSFGVRVGLF